MFAAEVLSNIERKPLYFLMSFKHMELNKVSDQLLGWKTVFGTKEATEARLLSLLQSHQKGSLCSAAENGLLLWLPWWLQQVTILVSERVVLNFLYCFLENINYNSIIWGKMWGDLQWQIYDTSNRGHKTIFTTVQERYLQLVMFFLDLKKMAHRSVCVAFRS